VWSRNPTKVHRGPVLLVEDPLSQNESAEALHSSSGYVAATVGLGDDIRVVCTDAKPTMG
jgi:hypothetical protein